MIWTTYCREEKVREKRKRGKVKEKERGEKGRENVPN